MNILKTSKTTQVSKLAGSIAKSLRADSSCQVDAVGATPVELAAKAITLARKFLLDENMDIIIKTEFFTAVGENRDSTGIKFILERQELK